MIFISIKIGWKNGEIFNGFEICPSSQFWDSPSGRTLNLMVTLGANMLFCCILIYLFSFTITMIDLISFAPFPRSMRIDSMPELEHIFSHVSFRIEINESPPAPAFAEIFGLKCDFENIEILGIRDGYFRNFRDEIRIQLMQKAVSLKRNQSLVCVFDNLIHNFWDQWVLRG